MSSKRTKLPKPPERSSSLANKPVVNGRSVLPEIQRQTSNIKEVSRFRRKEKKSKTERKQNAESKRVSDSNITKSIEILAKDLQRLKETNTIGDSDLTEPIVNYRTETETSLSCCKTLETVQKYVKSYGLQVNNMDSDWHDSLVFSCLH